MINGFRIISETDRFKGRRRIVIAVCKLCQREYETCKAYLIKANSCSCSWKTNNVPRRLQRIYCTMKGRCHTPTAHAYDKYGARGIFVCDDWRNDSHKFYDWALTNGYDSKLTLDRIDNNKGYYPDNCRWATPAEQQRNRMDSRFDINDIKFIRTFHTRFTRKELAKMFNCNEGAISRIINNRRFKDIQCT